MTPAEKQKAYRERKRNAAPSKEAPANATRDKLLRVIDELYLTRDLSTKARHRLRAEVLLASEAS